MNKTHLNTVGKGRVNRVHQVSAHLLTTSTPTASCHRLRDHDRRLHDVHQCVNMHRQLPAHQPPHRVRPAQPLQLLRPEGRGLSRTDKLRLFYKYFKLKKMFLLFSSLLLRWRSCTVGRAGRGGCRGA